MARSSMKTAGFGVTPLEKMLNKQRALDKGKPVVFTVANPNKEETNKPFIKVKVSPQSRYKKMKEVS